MITLLEYYNELEKHDWYFNYSDDHRVWSNGNSNLKRLQKLSMLSEKHRDLYEAYEAHIFSGDAFGRIKQLKPEKPKE